jgi:hypothetical protein
MMREIKRVSDFYKAETFHFIFQMHLANGCGGLLQERLMKSIVQWVWPRSVKNTKGSLALMLTFELLQC